MYFQFLIEDLSTEILINHVIEKLKAKYPDREIYADTKSFKGIGHLATHGNLMERKGGNLLNNLLKLPTLISVMNLEKSIL